MSRAWRSGAARVAGWAAIAFGAVHLAAAPLERRPVWRALAAEGVWDTVVLDPETPEGLARSEALWLTIASCAAPLMTTGGLVLHLTRRGDRVPGWVGWGTLAWGVPLTVLVPRSPAWVVPAVGGLLVAAARVPT